MENIKQFFFLYGFSFLSGVCGSLAGQTGKIAFSSTDFYDTGVIYVNYAIRAISFILMLNFNKLMLKFLFNSFELLGATLTTMLNFICNNAFNAFSGYFFHSETIHIQWVLGMALIMLGIVIIKGEQEKQGKIEAEITKKNN